MTLRSGLHEDPAARCARALATLFAAGNVCPLISDIAKTAECSRNGVRTYLAEARRRGLLILTFRLPTDTNLASQLRDKFSLRDASVTPTPVKWGDQDSIRSALAGETLHFLAAVTRKLAASPTTKGTIRIGIDGGQSLYAAAHDAGVFEFAPASYVLVPLVFGPFEGSSYSSSVVANLLATRLRAANIHVDVEDSFQVNRSRVRVEARGAGDPSISFTVDPRQSAAAGLDLLLVGLGSERDGLFQREWRRLGRTSPKGHHGDIMNLAFDRDGRELPHLNRTRATLLSFEQLRSAAASQGSLVIAVAGGESKLDAIRVALSKGLLSVLITDATTAAALLE